MTSRVQGTHKQQVKGTIQTHVEQNNHFTCNKMKFLNFDSTNVHSVIGKPLPNSHTKQVTEIKERNIKDYKFLYNLKTNWSD